VFGFSKVFAIIIVIAIIVSIGMRNVYIGIQIVAVYAIIRIFWNILTKGKK